MGERIPGVWFRDRTTNLHICTGCNGNGNTCLNPSQSLPIGKETKVTVRVNGGVFTAQYGDREVGRVTCTSPFKPRKSQLAYVYMSDNWYPSGNADIKSVVYTLPSNRLLTLAEHSTSLRKGNKVADIPVSANYEVSFTLTPRGVSRGWTNVFHITTNGNCCNMGERIPGVWFRDRTTNLHICTGCNGNGNTCLNPTEALPIGKETHITVRVNGGVFTTQYNSREVGRVICTSPYKPTKDQLAMVYVSDKYYPSANTVIKDFIYRML